MQRYWCIRGYNSLELFFETRVKHGQITPRQLQALLRTLVAKAGLTYEEIIGAYATQGTRIANELLHVRPERETATYTCGTNPYFTASVVDELGKVIRFREQ